MITESLWFAVQTRPMCEQRVKLSLIQKGYQCLVPTYRQMRKWCYRFVEVELPLFPMYVFCCATPSLAGRVITTQGVTRLVAFGGRLAEIETHEIEALQRLAQSNLVREPWMYLPNGTTIQVETGPLAGIRGKYCLSDNKHRIIINVTILQQSVAVQLDEGAAISVIEEARGESQKSDDSGRKITLTDQSDLALSLIQSAKM
jgi:transcriptional antiterminator RfaH